MVSTLYLSRVEGLQGSQATATTLAVLYISYMLSSPEYSVHDMTI